LISRRMKPKVLFALATLVTLSIAPTLRAEVEPGFTSLMDGKSFDGWKSAEENKDTWKIEDGAFVAHGSRCHLFYAGEDKPFKNFHLKVEVMTEPNSNG